MLTWIKEHPYMAGGIAAGMFVLYLIFRNSSSSASSSASSGGSYSPYGYVPSDAVQQAELSAGTQLQAYQIAAQAQTNTQNAQLQSQAQSEAANVQIAYYQNQAQLQQTLSGQESTDLQTEAGVQTALISAGQTLALAGKQAAVTYSPNGVVYGAAQAAADAAAAQTQQQAAVTTAVASLPSPSSAPSSSPVSVASGAADYPGVQGNPSSPASNSEAAYYQAANPYGGSYNPAEIAASPYGLNASPALGGSGPLCADGSPADPITGCGGGPVNPENMPGGTGMVIPSMGSGIFGSPAPATGQPAAATMPNPAVGLPGNIFGLPLGVPVPAVTP